MKSLSFIFRYEPQIYAILRMVTGFLFLWHGSQKLFDFPPSESSAGLTPLRTAAGIIEFFGGLMVMIGLWTRWAAFIASGEMAYAFWIVHFPNGILPIENRGELSMLYCFLFLYIFVRGTGKWGVMGNKSI